MARIKNVSSAGVDGGARSMDQAPSQQVVATSLPQHAVTDRRGRNLVIRRPSALQKFMLMDALGSSADNKMLFMHSVLAASVVEIDGEPVQFPRSKTQVQALVQRLDDDGIDAAADVFAKAAEDQAGDAEAAVALAKNS